MGKVLKLVRGDTSVCIWWVVGIPGRGNDKRQCPGRNVPFVCEKQQEVVSVAAAREPRGSGSKDNLN